MNKPEQTSNAQARRHRFNGARAVGLELLGLGGAALLTSIVYSSSILAMIGLGLIFWGITLFYIQSDEYIKGALLEPTVEPSLETMNRIVQELGYRGNAIYLPPAYFKNPETSKVYIARKEDRIPRPEQILAEENQLFTKNQEGLLIDAPGAELSRLFEKTLGTSFTKVDLKYLQQNLSKLIVEDLEIAQDSELKEDGDKVYVTLENCVYKSPRKDAANAVTTQSSLGSPLASAIACALAKATGMPIRVTTEKRNDNGKDLKIEYNIIRKEYTA